MVDDRRWTVADAVAGRSILDAGRTPTSMIGAAPMFSRRAMFGGLGVAQVLLLFPLRSTILKPYLYLLIQSFIRLSFTSQMVARNHYQTTTTKSVRIKVSKRHILRRSDKNQNHTNSSHVQ